MSWVDSDQRGEFKSNIEIMIPEMDEVKSFFLALEQHSQKFTVIQKVNNLVDRVDWEHFSEYYVNQWIAHLKPIGCALKYTDFLQMIRDLHYSRSLEADIVMFIAVK